MNKHAHTNKFIIYAKLRSIHRRKKIMKFLKIIINIINVLKVCECISFISFNIILKKCNLTFEMTLEISLLSLLILKCCVSSKISSKKRFKRLLRVVVYKFQTILCKFGCRFGRNFERIITKF